MNVFILIILLFIIFIGIGIFIKWQQIKIYYWKKKFINSAVEKNIESIMNKNIPCYKHLSNTYKNKLKNDTYILSNLKTIEGIEIQINDEIKYTIFGLAGLLLLGDENTSYYPNMTSVVVYPRAYISDQNGKEKSVNLGESWNFGTVVLSWSDVKKGAENFHDGHNVVLHEFAHQLDQQTGRADGIPANLNVDYYTWKNTFDAEYENLILEMKNAHKDSIDFYGTTNTAEFFAVSTETFFEDSENMKKEHFDLYQLFVKYYRLDPIEVFHS